MKGSRAALGDENVAVNGYRYVKTSTGWRLKHHLVAEKTLGRALLPTERAFFKDKDRTNFAPSNIGVALKNASGNSGLNKRLTTIEEKMVAVIEDSNDPQQVLKELHEILERLVDVYAPIP